MNLKELIQNNVNEYMEDDTIIVLKGFDINLLYRDLIIDIDKILEDKMKHFMEIYFKRRKVIIFEEYLALYDFIISQYKKIIILENNLYINYYPLHCNIKKELLDLLLIHFDEDKEHEIAYDLIKEYVNIYANLKQIDGNIYVVYNYNIKNEKEYTVNIFDAPKEDVERVEIENNKACIQILEEEDYIRFLNIVFSNTNNKFYIIDQNSTIRRNTLVEKLNILEKYFNGKIKLYFAYTKYKKSTSIKKEYYDILKRHWGNDSFRTLKIYNINQLELNKKEIEEISQGEIVSNIVEQVENCINNKDYRDIFVTAPTGSGKSVMFQIPAIYLAEKYGLFTIVISPLIGLMKDQVRNLEVKNYNYARTINSDISPIEKQKIINDIKEGNCHILYISPESLLSKSDLEQIIGDRTLGLLVVDEAHIVTTWGKQFRPDYWYLGDHLNKIKKVQLKKKGMGFVIASFTATAIYGGVEDMYEETVQSLRMVNPIVYLGYIKRDNIKINIDKTKTIRNRTEYELNKFDDLLSKIDQIMMLNKKMLIYFPTVALLERFYEYCIVKNIFKYVARYHGKMNPIDKDENYIKFLNGEKPIMLATKAFGMGVDIEDIDVVAHFAPTGNLCDYVQEIGRAARRRELTGEAYYKFMSNDFKHINRLHGLSIIKEYQLVEVIKKVYEIFQENIRRSKKIGNRREMLVDAESFAHIFDNSFLNEDDGINKVKTAMLLIQKDFERKLSFSPFYVRPIPLFERGFFKVSKPYINEIINDYGNVIELVEDDIYSINLKHIWDKDFSNEYSFPKFKFLLYSNSKDLDFKYKNILKPAIRIEISLNRNYLKNFINNYESIKTLLRRCVREGKYYSIDELVESLINSYGIEVYKAKCIVENIINALNIFKKEYNKNLNTVIIKDMLQTSGEIKYIFYNGIENFFKWIEKFYEFVLNLDKTTFYVVENETSFKEIFTLLGILETLDILVFNALGGQNSQLYIYVNQTKTLKEIIEDPRRYKNRLLELVRERHKISVAMMTYMFENDFTNDEIWEIIENYFLGLIPDKVIKIIDGAI